MTIEAVLTEATVMFANIQQALVRLPGWTT
jgi:hypothetical protein